MKSLLRYTIALCFSALLFTSCEDELLDQSNPNAITTDTFWQTKADFEKAQNAMYSALQFHNVSGGGIVMNMMRSDLAGSESWYAIHSAFSNMQWTNAHDFVVNHWSNLYTGIYRANQVIYYTEATDVLTEGEKDLILAQARFVRAICYFWLSNSYGDAVLHDQLVFDDVELHKGLSSREDIVAFIISDLEYAMTHLPKKWEDSGDLGRATWGAATALLGKVYLYDKAWNKAAQYFKMVIDEADDKGLYALVDDYMSNFTTEGEFNSESIFEVAFSDNYKVGTPGDRQDDVGDVAGSEATAIAGNFSSIYAGGYNTCLPTYWLQELYIVGDSMDVSNPSNLGRFVSQRTYASVVVLNERDGNANWDTDETYYNAPLVDKVDENGDEIKAKANMAFGQGAKVKKYTNWYKSNAEDSENAARTGINFRHIRLADVYLMYAEAVLEDAGNTSEALKYVEKVRERAGVLSLQHYIDNMGGIPQLHISRYANNLASHPVEALSAETLLRHIRMVERPLELAFEGHRWYDLVRWGIVKDVITTNAADELRLTDKMMYFDEAEAKMKMKPEVERTYPFYLIERVRPDWQKPLSNYSSAEHDYLPIPNLESQSNKNL